MLKPRWWGVHHPQSLFNPESDLLYRHKKDRRRTNREDFVFFDIKIVHREGALTAQQQDHSSPEAPWERKLYFKEERPPLRVSHYSWTPPAAFALPGKPSKRAA